MNDVERGLPELSDEAVARIELGVLADIERGRQQHSGKRAKKRRGWIGGSVAAAAVVAGAIVVVPLVQNEAMDASSGGAADYAAAPGGSADSQSAEQEGPSDERRVVRTGSAVVVVDDVAAASESLTELADEYGGYIEDLGSSSDRETGEAGNGWITLRIPADDLDAVRASLADLGDVREEQVTSSDVTAQSVDLEARIDSLTASVDRLNELMAKAGSVGDLLEAEQALSERQAELESLQREYERLGDQVAMSTFSVELAPSASAADVDPSGFGDGLLAGWNGLVAFLGGLVVVVGTVLPWLGAAGVVAIIVWLIVRIARRRRR